MKEKYLKKIPAVNDLLNTVQGEELIKLYSREQVVKAIRKVTDKIRKKILSEDNPNLEDLVDEENIIYKVNGYLTGEFRPKLVKVVNATGIILHTNLGRAILSKSAQRSLLAVASNYSTLEIDVETGERGSRYNNVKELLQKLTGAEDVLIVNNNAAAVLLALSSLAQGKEVIISRGQLVEIGGSFRIPDVMKQSGGKLVEVGTTNKVYITDYKEAITEETGLLLKVHTSNYKIVGFTETVHIEDLVKLGKEKEIPVMEDLGSGILLDLTDYGLSYEPTVQDSIKAGADIVTISGDKLLGGPQAGIILGKRKYIEKMKSHPLNRALRVDKLTLAALEATLREYLNIERAKTEIPTLRMLTTPIEVIKKRAQLLYEKLQETLSENFTINMKKDYSKVGGGAFPAEKLGTFVIEIEHNDLDEETIAKRLRMNYPPVFCRRNNNKVILDLRTIKKEDIVILIDALLKLVEG